MASMSLSPRYRILDSSSNGHASIQLDGQTIEVISNQDEALSTDNLSILGAALQAAVDHANSHYVAPETSSILDSLMSTQQNGPSLSLHLLSKQEIKKRIHYADGYYDSEDRSVNISWDENHDISPETAFHEIFHAIDDVLKADPMVAGSKKYAYFSEDTGNPMIYGAYVSSCNSVPNIHRYRRILNTKFNLGDTSHDDELSELREEIRKRGITDPYGCYTEQEWFANQGADPLSSPSRLHFFILLLQDPNLSADEKLEAAQLYSGSLGNANADEIVEIFSSPNVPTDHIIVSTFCRQNDFEKNLPLLQAVLKSGRVSEDIKSKITEGMKRSFQYGYLGDSNKIRIELMRGGVVFFEVLSAAGKLDVGCISVLSSKVLAFAKENRNDLEVSDEYVKMILDSKISPEHKRQVVITFATFLASKYDGTRGGKEKQWLKSYEIFKAAQKISPSFQHGDSLLEKFEKTAPWNQYHFDAFNSDDVADTDSVYFWLQSIEMAGIFFELDPLTSGASLTSIQEKRLKFLVLGLFNQDATIASEAVKQLSQACGIPNPTSSKAHFSSKSEVAPSSKIVETWLEIPNLHAEIKKILIETYFYVSRNSIDGRIVLRLDGIIRKQKDLELLDVWNANFKINPIPDLSPDNGPLSLVVGSRTISFGDSKFSSGVELGLNVDVPVAGGSNKFSFLSTVTPSWEISPEQKYNAVTLGAQIGFSTVFNPNNRFPTIAYDTQVGIGSLIPTTGVTPEDRSSLIALEIDVGGGVSIKTNPWMTFKLGALATFQIKNGDSQVESGSGFYLRSAFSLKQK